MKFKVCTAVSGLVAAAALSFSVAAHADDSLKAVMAKKSIALGIPTDYPPYG